MRAPRTMHELPVLLSLSPVDWEDRNRILPVFISLESSTGSGRQQALVKYMLNDWISKRVSVSPSLKCGFGVMVSDFLCFCDWGEGPAKG